MKFNEKLIELRKKEGLSQEELGYKLNVTRQTISKWELGQTTPEMEKLVEISNLFGISVDNLINGEEVQSKSEIEQEPVIEDKPIKEKNSNNKVAIILIVVIVVLLVFGIFKLFTASSIFNNVFNKITGTIEQGMENQNEVSNKAENLFENIFDNAQNMISDATSEMNTSEFNSELEGYNGSNFGQTVKKLLDNIITSNKTKEKKITVKYLEISTQDADEIKNLKTNIGDLKNYEVSFEYDEEEYIYEVLIERVYTEFEISSFNALFEIYAGTKMGGSVISAVDKIITSNKTEERKIMVVFNEKETQDETEIRNIKKNINTFDDYELTFEYDENGFIKKAIIEKI